MKTKYWIGIFAALLALSAALSIPLLLPGQASTHAQISSEGNILHRVDLRIDQELTVTNSSGNVNVITVQDGKIAVTQADCPDHYCMHRGFCNSGAQIVCLPNLLVITFTDDQEIDIVAG